MMEGAFPKVNDLALWQFFDFECLTYKKRKIIFL